MAALSRGEWGLIPEQREENKAGQGVRCYRKCGAAAGRLPGGCLHRPGPWLPGAEGAQGRKKVSGNAGCTSEWRGETAPEKEDGNKAGTLRFSYLRGAKRHCCPPPAAAGG